MSRKSTVMVKRSIYQMGVVTVTASVIWIGVAIYQTLVTPVDVNVPVEIGYHGLDLVESSTEVQE